MASISLTTAINLRKNGNYQQSREILFSLLKSAEDPGVILLHIAWSFDNQGVEQQALEFYSQALLYPLSEADRFEALFGQACSQRCLGQWGLAEHNFAKLRDDYPQAIEVIPFYALCLKQLSKDEQAFTLIFDQLLASPCSDRLKPYQQVLQRYHHSVCAADP